MLKYILFSFTLLTALNSQALETCSQYMSSPIMQVSSQGRLSLLVFEPTEQIEVDFNNGNSLLSLTYTEEELNEFIALRVKLTQGQGLSKDTLDFLKGPLNRDLSYSIELSPSGQIVSFSETNENLSFEGTSYDGAFKTVAYETHYTEDGNCFVKSITNAFSGSGESAMFFLEEPVTKD